VGKLLAFSHSLSPLKVFVGNKHKMASTPLSARIDELEKTLRSLSKQVAGDENARKKLLGVVREQTIVLESPVEVSWRMIMEVCAVHCFIKDTLR
jgi:hypothetical protein